MRLLRKIKAPSEIPVSKLLILWNRKLRRVLSRAGMFETGFLFFLHSSEKMAGDSSESPAIVTKRRSLLRDDEGLRVHPIRVTQFAQRTDLELIDSSQRQPTDSYFPGFD